MSEEDKNKAAGMSRKDFLKSAGLVFGGAALSGMASVTEAAAQTAKSTNRVHTTSGSTQPSYETYDTDILVIGGGLAATQTALVAFKQGANVTLVDKGPFRFSGSGGYNWDLATGWCSDPDLVLKTEIAAEEGIVEQRVVKAAYQASKEYDNFAKYMDHGCTFLGRMPDGSFMAIPGQGETFTFNNFLRHDMDEVKNNGVAIFDRTMITQLLTQDGRCVGAMGLHLPTGTFRVFRAKQTISGAGSGAWILGWTTVGAHTISGPDTTGDLTAIAYRNGCEVYQSEFNDLDTIIAEPRGIAYSYNAGIGCDPLLHPVFANKDGEHFLLQYKLGEVTRGIFLKEAYKQIQAGKGGANGGVFVDLRDVNGQPSPFWPYVPEYYLRSIDLLKERFGVDVRKRLVEVMFDKPDIYGVPVIDEHMQTEIPGLYFARSLTNEQSTMTINCGVVAGKYAAAQVRNNLVDMPRSISLEQVENEIGRLQDILNRKTSNPLRPHQVRRLIQKTAGDHLGALREGKGLQACVDELSRIRAEVLPRMSVSLKTRTYNIEWKQAIENYNMLDFAEMIARTSLMRKESRSSFFRTDYHNRDDANFLCWIAAKQVNGKMTVRKRPIDTSSYSLDQVRQMIASEVKA